MRFRNGYVALSLTVLLQSACSASNGAATDLPDTKAEALEVVERTKVVDATYAIYNWNRITLPGKEPVEEWSAEFHSGDLHRVETPRDRIIADCQAGTGFAVSLLTKEVIEGPQVAKAACGINTNASIVGAQWLGEVSTPFGSADRIRIVDKNHVRQYDVTPEGVLLGGTISENEPGEQLLLATEAVKLDSVLPAPSMFDRKSLESSFVPEEYKVRRTPQ